MLSNPLEGDTKNIHTKSNQKTGVSNAAKKSLFRRVIGMEPLKG